MSKDTIQILIVDDEPLILDMLYLGLTSANHNVLPANNGLEALHLLAKHDFDLVLMDIRMPVMDGITATKFLRSCEQGDHKSLTEHSALAHKLHAQRSGKRVPIVAVTGNLGDSNLVMQAGMDNYIAKPFEFNVVYEMVDLLCEKSSRDNNIEKRTHQRYAIRDNSILLVNGSVGQVIDISLGGLAVTFQDKELPPDEWRACCYNKITQSSTPALPIKLVRQEKYPRNDSTKVSSQTIGALFHNPSESQLNGIKQVIATLQ